MIVPFNDLARINLAIQDELEGAFKKVMARSRFIQDEETHAFENNFANYLDVKHCVGCGNATDALEIILRAIELKESDEVLVPAMTYMATAEAVLNAGAKPKFVDIDPVFHGISPFEIEKIISPNTRAIIVVHLYGCPVDMEPIIKIAGKHGLFVIEDCAQAHGAEYKGVKAGGLGNAAAFSFYPTKNLGAMGDGGAIVTNNGELAGKCRMIANHGQILREDYQILGRNSRLDELQAAFLNVKLKYLDQWNGQRTVLANRYLENLKGSGLISPTLPDYGQTVHHLFVARFHYRDFLHSELAKRGVQTLVHYKKILPDLPPFKGISDNDYPIARKNAHQVISLPLFPGMLSDEVDYVCNSIGEILGSFK
jgi:dTDP-4-amino-4,6-dideoxygalactose transaminase